MAMDNVARNFYNLGLSMPDVFKIVSLNPATVLHMEEQIGSLAVDKKADILILDENLNLRQTFFCRAAGSLSRFEVGFSTKNVKN